MLRAAHLRGRSWRGNLLIRLLGSVLNSQPMLTLPRIRHPTKVDDGQYLMPVAAPASYAARQFLCRQSPGLQVSNIRVLALMWALSGPRDMGASRLPFPHSYDQLLSCESLCSGPRPSPFMQCIYPGSYSAFSHLHMSYQITYQITDI